jgi:pyruvate/2-oxoglutarate dehydrogenase complex dihydrolipoamide dehydrogenase (E3) component
MSVNEHDVVVVGMGPGGEDLAGRAAEAGMDVLAIEAKLVGGECPYWGCIPSKVMVRAGDSIAEAARAVGLAGDIKISPKWAPVARRVREVTAGWDDTAAVERLERAGGTLLRGRARLAGPDEVEVDGETYRARRALVIASGTDPMIPPIDGLRDVEFWTNREAIEAEELPRHLVILGGGAIGLELGQAFSRFGSDVTIVEMADRLVPMEEPENSDAIERVLAEEGLTVVTGTGADKITSSEAGIVVGLADGRAVEGDRLLVAVGRSAGLAELGVESAGLDPKARWIEVDDNLRVAPGVWAIGDVTGRGAFTHISMYQARLALADILGREHAAADYSAVPRVTFTDPEVASVGLSEAQAREKGLKVRTGKTKSASSARGYIHGPGAEHGVMKLVADMDRDVLVGASVASPAAGEIIGLATLAVRARVPLGLLRELIYPYPTFVRGLEDALRDLLEA